MEAVSQGRIGIEVVLAGHLSLVVFQPGIKGAHVTKTVRLQGQYRHVAQAYRAVAGNGFQPYTVNFSNIQRKRCVTAIFISNGAGLLTGSKVSKGSIVHLG